jgi:hypothetical protein
LREPDHRRLLTGQQAEAQGIRQQLPRKGALVPFSHQPPKVPAEGSHLPGEFLTLASSLVMTQMPEPALMRSVTDQDLAAFV